MILINQSRFLKEKAFFFQKETAFEFGQGSFAQKDIKVRETQGNTSTLIASSEF